MKHALMVALVCAVAGCGGTKRASSGDYDRVTRFSTGPISKACLKSDRKAANRQLCGCIQTVANNRLSGTDQKMAASFFDDPHKAQEIRQSDNGRHERFWDKYKAFASTAESQCRGY